MANIALPFKMQRQVQSNWCWAANAASIALFYDPSSGATQCKTACASLQRTDCCAVVVSPACNVPYYLQTALLVNNVFRDWQQGSVGMSIIIQEINSSLIIGARIGWRSGGGHFVSIYGFNNNAEDSFVYVADPIYGETYINLNNFSTNYLSAGDWTHTYFTNKNSSLGGHDMLQFNPLNEGFIKKAREMAPPGLLKENADFTKPMKEWVQKAHTVYNVNFDSLKLTDKMVFEITGERAIDDDNEGRKVILEFSGVGGHNGLSGILYGNQYTDSYTSLLDRLIEEEREYSEDYILSLVRLPSLKVDALWLHSFAKDGRDWFVPTFANDFLEQGKRYSSADFRKLLLSNAKKQKFYDDDQLGG